MIYIICQLLQKTSGLHRTHTLMSGLYIEPINSINKPGAHAMTF